MVGGGVYVNGSLVDSKPADCEPSVSSKAPGSNVFISVQHLDFTWAIVPVFIPESAGRSGRPGCRGSRTARCRAWPVQGS